MHTDSGYEDEDSGEEAFPRKACSSSLQAAGLDLGIHDGEEGLTTTGTMLLAML